MAVTKGMDQVKLLPLFHSRALPVMNSSPWHLFILNQANQVVIVKLTYLQEIFFLSTLPSSILNKLLINSSRGFQITGTEDVRNKVNEFVAEDNNRERVNDIPLNSTGNNDH